MAQPPAVTGVPAAVGCPAAPYGARFYAPGSSKTVARIIRLAEQKGGALRHPIVLMHNQPIGNPATVSALPAIIQFFRSHGYRFVAL